MKRALLICKKFQHEPLSVKSYSVLFFWDFFFLLLSLLFGRRSDDSANRRQTTPSNDSQKCDEREMWCLSWCRCKAAWENIHTFDVWEATKWNWLEQKCFSFFFSCLSTEHEEQLLLVSCRHQWWGKQTGNNRKPSWNEMSRATDGRFEKWKTREKRINLFLIDFARLLGSLAFKP